MLIFCFLRITLIQLQSCFPTPISSPWKMMLFVLFLAAAAGRWAESLSLEIPLKDSLQFRSPRKGQPCHSLKIGCGDDYLPSPAPKRIPCVFKAFVENMNLLRLKLVINLYEDTNENNNS